MLKVIRKKSTEIDFVNIVLLLIEVGIRCDFLDYNENHFQLTGVLLMPSLPAACKISYISQ